MSQLPHANATIIPFPLGKRRKTLVPWVAGGIERTPPQRRDDAGGHRRTPIHPWGMAGGARGDGGAPVVTGGRVRGEGRPADRAGPQRATMWPALPRSTSCARGSGRGSPAASGRSACRPAPASRASSARWPTTPGSSCSSFRGAGVCRASSRAPVSSWRAWWESAVDASPWSTRSSPSCARPIPTTSSRRIPACHRGAEAPEGIALAVTVWCGLALPRPASRLVSRSHPTPVGRRRRSLPRGQV